MCVCVCDSPPVLDCTVRGGQAARQRRRDDGETGRRAARGDWGATAVMLRLLLFSSAFSFSG